MSGAIPLETVITHLRLLTCRLLLPALRFSGEAFGEAKMNFRIFEPVNGTNQSTLAYHGCAAAC